MSDLMILYGMGIFLAVFMGVMLAASFRASWNVENGLQKRAPSRTDTGIWVDPIVFIIMLVFTQVLYLGVNGKKNGYIYIFSTLVDIFLFISIYFTLLLVFLPLLRRHYTARTCATLWLIPVFLFYQPNINAYFQVELPRAVFYIPKHIMQILFGIWLAGFLIILWIQVISHVHFSWKLKKMSVPVTNPELTEVWEEEKNKLGLDFPVGLRMCRMIRTPLTVGMWKKRRITYLSEEEYNREEAELVFSHELHHIQRNDTHTKFFLRFCNAFGWLHPFVWLAVKRAEDDLELSCDEIVLKDADRDRRKTYARLLLTTAGNSRGFTTCLSASAKTLRYRMKETMGEKKKKLGIGLLFLVMFISCFSIGRIALATDRMSLKDVLQTETFEITHANLTDRTDGIKTREITDVNGLSAYLSQQQAEKMVYRYQPGFQWTDRQKWNLVCEIASGDVVFYIAGDYMEVYRNGYAVGVLYHMAKPLELEYIKIFAEK